MGQGVVDDDLHQGDGDLVHAAADAHAERLQVIAQVRAEVLPAEADCPEFPQVAHSQRKGEELAQHGGQGRSEYAPVAGEDENGIEDCVGSGAGHHAEHGVFGASVRPDQVAHAVGDDEEGHSQQGDARILQGVGQHVRRGAEDLQKRFQQKLTQSGVDQSGHGHQDHTVSGDFGRLVRLLLPQTEGEAGGAPDAHQQCDGKADGGEGVGHVGGGVAQVAYALADKDLIHNVVQGTD